MQDTTLAAAKAQIDAGFRVLEAIAEATRRYYEAQLEAAVEAHAKAEATRKQLEQARDLPELWRVESEYLSCCAKESLAHWNSLREIALEAQGNVARCFGQPGAAPSGATAGAPLMEIMDTAYKRWLETTRQFYAAPIVAQPQVRTGDAA
jgi:hypothetical protein